LLCLPGLAPAASVGPAEREKARLETLREQRTALERQLKEAETSRAATADQLRDTEKAISGVGRKLRALGEERAATRAELAEQEQKLKQLERQTATRQNQLARLLRYQFRPQEADALSVLLAGGDPNVVARDRYFLALLSRAKADLIADLRQDAAETQRLKGLVQQRGEKLAELVQREEGERAALRQRQQERQAVLGKISGQIKAQRREIETIRQNEQRLGNLIASLAKKATQARSAKPRNASRADVPPPAQTVKAEPGITGGVFAKLRGRLSLPVRGGIAGRFGTRREDGQSVWKGLFIRAAEGADVRAVAGARLSEEPAQAHGPGRPLGPHPHAAPVIVFFVRGIRAALDGPANRHTRERPARKVLLEFHPGPPGPARTRARTTTAPGAYTGRTGCGRASAV